MDASIVLAGVRLVPVVVLDEPEAALPLAETLFAAGISAIEVTLRTERALACIESIATRLPEVIVGAGSVRTTEQLSQAKSAGALFAVSPGASPSLLSAALEHQMPFVPGAVTASEMIRLLEDGYRLQKFFPAELAGGLPMLRALSAPLPEVRFFPTGGIDLTLARAYLGFEKVACIGGSWFVPATSLADRDFEGIGKLAREAVSICHA